MSGPMSREVDLLYTDVEDALRESLRALLAERCPSSAVTALYDGDRSVVRPLWSALAGDLGLAGLLVPEQHGGAGASAREAAVVLEELGRTVAPVPFLTSAVVATTAVASVPSLLRLLASGERTAALAVGLSATSWTLTPAVVAERDRLTGTVTAVAGALEADDLLVPVATGAGLALWHVDASAPGVQVQPVVSLDMTRQLADVAFDHAPAVRVVPVEAGDQAVRGALDAGAALLASEQVGSAAWCVESTVSYLRERRQFGRPVGSFQAVKHRLADLWAAVESARAAARYAAATLAAGDPDQVLAASLAQAYCSEVAVSAAEECVQLHGGLGMTWEHPAHLHLKRAKADQVALGSPGRHRRRVGALVDLVVAD